MAVEEVPAEDPIQPSDQRDAGLEIVSQPEHAEEELDGDSRLPFPIAAIGASAGGIEASIPLIEHIPPDTGIAFVILLHLATDVKSLLPEILAAHTKMPVVTIADGMRPEPNHFYVLGANAEVRLSQGIFHVSPRPPELPPRTIDTFFRSLAKEQKTRAVGVILSGMDGDGALGMKAIRGEGGIAMVQSPETARFPAMPRSSIGMDRVDLILTPELLGAQFAILGKQFQNPEFRRLDGVLEGPMEQHFARILMLMKVVSGVDFKLYKPNTIRRRIARRMLLHRIESLAAYEVFLRSNPREVRDLQEDSLISVTRFFRDPEVFEALQTSVYPRIFDLRPPDEQVRVWVAGCSTGEEVYSLAISMLEYTMGKSQEPPIQIFGTDASEQNIGKARAGIYPDCIHTEVSPERLRRFFSKTDKGYLVAKRVRDLCIFARQNLCHDPPFSRMDLISCRNVLIYFGAALQRQLIPTFHYALQQDGFLVLGSSETIRESTDLFTMIDRKHKIYGKIGTSPPRALVQQFPPAFVRDIHAAVPLRETGLSWEDAELQRAADRIVLARFGPPGVVVNDALEILQSRGHNDEYFQIPAGPARLSLSRMAREEIAPQLLEAVRRAIDTDGPVQSEILRFGEKNRPSRTVVEVIPLHHVNSRPGYYLVLFVEGGAGAGAPQHDAQNGAAILPDERDLIVEKLRQDLTATRVYLQSLLEERDARNQELLSANEEIQSANEELQSTNEELETTKEELQSANEELQTVNDELQNRNTVLTEAGNDLSNLLNSVSLPVLMLSNELNIRHFTPPVQKLMNVRQSDLGRPLLEIRMNLDIENLEPLLHEVLETLNAREIEVRDREGRWHLLRVRPYRTVDNKIDGLVLVLVDIDQLRRSEQELREARDFGRLVLGNIPLPLVFVDMEDRIQVANDAFCELAGTTASDLEKRSLADLAGARWGLGEPFRAKLAGIREQAAGSAKGFDFTHKTSADGGRTLAFRGRVLQPGAKGLLLLTVEDTTDRTEVERRLEAERERLAVQVEQTTRELERNREELRALARSLFTSQEDERRRVARELHDDIGQRLSLVIGAVETQRAEGDESARGKLRELHRNLFALARDLRNISHRLHPSIIEDLGLASALRSLTDEFRVAERMITDFSAQDLPHLPIEVAVGLYRIAQEALRNVARHAGRTHVRVSLSRLGGGPDGDGVQLVVQDAGAGFDTATAPRGLGLISMEERAHQIGASLKVESKPGDGSRVTVEVPHLPPQAETDVGEQPPA